MNNQGNKGFQKENAPENKLRDIEIHDLNDRIQHCSSEKKKNSTRCKKTQIDNLMSSGKKISVNKISTSPKILNIKKEPKQKFWTQ